VGIKTVQTLLTLFILVSLNFFLPRLMPGDPLSYLDNNDPGAGSAMLLTEETRSQLLAYYGLDRPLGEQYLRYLGGGCCGATWVGRSITMPPSGMCCGAG